jgi:hypothetical protein
MKKLAVFLILAGLGELPAVAVAATYNDVPVVDVNCSAKAAANPDAHTRSCALACVKSGFGIITSDHQFLKFDAAGNKEIAAQLVKSKEKDHLRVNVTGDLKDGVLMVSSVKLL